MVDEIASLTEKLMISFHAAARQRITKEGLSLSQYFVLCFLDKDEKFRMSDVKKMLVSSGAFATNIADRLVKKGLIYRVRNHKDRRIVTVSLTMKGFYV